MNKFLANKYDLNEMVDVLDELPIWSAPFGLRLLEFVNYKKSISALDIGFGTGFPLTELAMRLGESSTVYGIDPWKESTDRAKRKIEKYRITNVTLIDGVAESIPLPDETLDLIVSNNGINNVNDIEKVISECSRLLKRDGQFIMTMNLDISMFEFYNEFESVLSGLNMENEIRLLHQHIYNKRRPLEEMIRILNDQGFIIKDMEHDQFNYHFSDGTALMNHYFIRVAFMESWIKIIPEEKAEEIFSIIESRLNMQAEILQGLKLSIPYVVINSIRH